MYIFENVSGLKGFVENYENMDFIDIWNEYIIFMKKTYRRKLTKLKKGNKHSEIEKLVDKLQLDIPQDFFHTNSSRFLL